MTKIKENQPKIFAFCNHKGGVGKTCSACNIGAGLALKGKKVLMVDMDPQANMTSAFGVKTSGANVYQLLMGHCSISDTIYNVHEGLDLIPGTLHLAGAEVEMGNEPGRESLLKTCLEDVCDKYDYVLIDCPPSLGLFTMNGLACAERAIIPLCAEPFAIDGVENLTKLISKVQKRVNSKLKIGGVLITRFDGRKNLNKDLAEVIDEGFREFTFKTRVRDNVSLAEANHEKKDIFRYSPKSRGAEDYDNVCEELLLRG